ncbi:MAG: TetR/AcrR family transcriptional regulator [Clostridiales bacterium]|nr:TetR/AcrR family transcriptional regulator [Clostridiales bacterium]
MSDIVRLSGVARKTFYRHFRDKYDLVNLYFLNFYAQSFDKIAEGEKWEDALCTYLTICEEKAAVLIHAYSSADANCLEKYDIELTEKTYRKYLLLKNADVDTKEMAFAIKIAAAGGTAMVIEWIRGGMKEDKAELVVLIKRTLPQDI